MTFMRKIRCSGFDYCEYCSWLALDPFNHQRNKQRMAKFEFYDLAISVSTLDCCWSWLKANGDLSDCLRVKHVFDLDSKLIAFECYCTYSKYDALHFY